MSIYHRWIFNIRLWLIFIKRSLIYLYFLYTVLGLNWVTLVWLSVVGALIQYGSQNHLLVFERLMGLFVSLFSDHITFESHAFYRFLLFMEIRPVWTLKVILHSCFYALACWMLKIWVILLFCYLFLLQYTVQ